jgi:replicative DNA helicase
MPESSSATITPLSSAAPLPVRQIPHNVEAEQALLGALLVDNRGLEKIGDFLRADHFYVPAHQRIFAGITHLTERGLSADPVTLKTYFETDSDLTHVGGAEYLHDLARGVMSIINTEDYARTLYDLFLRRSLIALGEDVVNDTYTMTYDESASDAIEAAEARLYKLSESGDARGGFLTLRDSVIEAVKIAEKAYQNKSRVTGVTTGLKDMDEKLGGLHPSDLIILAGRPSMGKTALATVIAFNAAKTYAETGGREGAQVGFFSLEMSADQMATRILADQASISGDAIRKGAIKQDEFRKFVEASHLMSQIPLFIDDTPALSISAIRTRARRLKSQHGLGLLVVDYLQLLRGTGSKQSESNRVLEVSEITRGLKALAKEFQIPVLALSQLSRAVESREDRRPQLSDLRESGSIEQDSDVVMFIYRHEYYLSREEPIQKPGEDNGKFNDRYAAWQEQLAKHANVAESIIAKQRHGPIGTVRMFFDPNFTRFKDLEQTGPWAG